MASFDGFLKEYPGISVDKFVERNFRSAAFFLSHCHLDHMTGIVSDSFENHLKNKDFVNIYCSEITSALLKSNSRLSLSKTVLSRLIALPEHFPSNVEVQNGPHKETISVTLLPAGHCLGSVMFLFDGDRGKVLYTGDFRYYSDQIASCDVLASLSGSLTALYLDTTFCHPDSHAFPTREECIRDVCRQIAFWRNKTKNAVINLECRMDYGYEPFFVALYQKFGEKIHVSPRKYSLYKGMTEILDALTTDGSKTAFHLCASECEWISKKRTKSADPGLYTVKLCAQTFVVRKQCGQISLPNSKSSFSYCYSMHSSFQEVKKFVDHLKPTSIIPCAFPTGTDSHQILRFLGVLDLKREANYTGVPQISPDVSVNFQGSTIVQTDTCSSEEEVLSFEDDLVLPQCKRLKL